MENSQYSGTCITGLISAAEGIRIRVEKKMDRLCRNCRQPFGSHANFGDWCPSEWPKPQNQTKFQEMTCQACESKGSWDEGQECGRECVPGSEFCRNHQEGAE